MKGLEEKIEKHRLFLATGLDSYRAIIKGEELQYLNVAEQNLQGARFVNVDFHGSRFMNTNFSFADFIKCNMTKCAFYNCNFFGANIKTSNFMSARFSDCDINLENMESLFGNGKQIKSMFISDYPIVWTSEYLQIGCQKKTIEEWRALDKEKANELIDFGWSWWEEHRDFIVNAIKEYPANKGVGIC